MNSQTYSIYDQIYDISRLAVQGPLSHRRMGVYEMQYICCRVSLQSLTRTPSLRVQQQLLLAHTAFSSFRPKVCVASVCCAHCSFNFRRQLRQQAPSPLRSVASSASKFRHRSASSPLRPKLRHIPLRRKLRRKLPRRSVARNSRSIGNRKYPQGVPTASIVNTKNMLIVVLHQWVAPSRTHIADGYATYTRRVALQYLDTLLMRITVSVLYTRWKRTRGKYTCNPKPKIYPHRKYTYSKTSYPSTHRYESSYSSKELNIQ